jgi:hypothetical protein
MTGNAGYVYVLLTKYTNSAGVPLVKIGRTSRAPNHRNREVSRGGPIGTTVVGAVTTRDMVALERKAHQALLHVRFIRDGGTAYFAADPNEVLTWLRGETPRFEIASARDSAWHEYVESPPWKKKSVVHLTGFITFMVLWAGGSVWLSGEHLLWMLLVMPFIAGALAFGVWYCLKHLLLDNLEAKLNAIRSGLEGKYNLPAGCLLSGPTDGYKHNARRGSR